MTSKEECQKDMFVATSKSALNELERDGAFIKFGIRGFEIDDERTRKYYSRYVNIIKKDLNKLKELTKTPTLEEVKKEWEALGWFFIGLHEDVKNKVSCIIISKYVGKNIFSTTDIQLDLEEKDCFIRGLLNYRELQLLTKTFKALGWENV